MRVQRCRRDRPSAPNNALEPRRLSICTVDSPDVQAVQIKELTGQGTYLR
jgi:hypothetical protein